MTPSAQVILSGTLTFGVPLVLAMRELVVLRRDNRGGTDWKERPRDPPPSPPDSEPGQRPLPACLVPELPAARAELRQPRVREREPA